MGGSAENSAVDPQLKLRGISNLRVADSSVLPNITSANTNAPVIMVAEKASDFIINDYKQLK